MADVCQSEYVPYAGRQQVEPIISCTMWVHGFGDHTHGPTGMTWAGRPQRFAVDPQQCGHEHHRDAAMLGDVKRRLMCMYCGTEKFVPWPGAPGGEPMMWAEAAAMVVADAEEMDRRRDAPADREAALANALTYDMLSPEVQRQINDLLGSACVHLGQDLRQRLVAAAAVPLAERRHERNVARLGAELDAAMRKTGVPEAVYLDAARDYIHHTGWECDGSKTAERQALNLSASDAWRDACGSVWEPAIAEGVRAGRDQAEAAIRVYAEKHATVVSGRPTRLGLHLEVAAQIAAEGAHGD